MAIIRLVVCHDKKFHRKVSSWWKGNCARSRWMGDGNDVDNNVTLYLFMNYSAFEPGVSLKRVFNVYAQRWIVLAFCRICELGTLKKGKINLYLFIYLLIVNFRYAYPSVRLALAAAFSQIILTVHVSRFWILDF